MTAWMVPYLADFHPADEEIDLRDLPEGTLNEPYLLTANAAFTAAILHKSGGFDPLLGPRAGVPFVNDDLALCRAVHAANQSQWPILGRDLNTLSENANRESARPCSTRSPCRGR